MEEAVAVRQLPSHQLWLGNASDGWDLRQTLAAGIRVVVDLALRMRQFK